jgi:DNA-binding MarR family transcriptional regulator
MTVKVETREAAEALRIGIGALLRRLRQVHPDGGLSMPEQSALSRLDREGPTTSSALAKLEQITPQSMGATVATLESRGLIQRRSDPADGRRSVLTLTRAGRDLVLRKRDASTERMARALGDFSVAEIEQLRAAAGLIERLAHAL